MAKDPESRKNRRYSVLILLLGLGLIAAGIIGIITSRADSIAYKNSTDIRKVDAVINAFSTREDESSSLVTETTFKFDVSPMSLTGKPIREDMRCVSRQGIWQKCTTMAGCEETIRSALRFIKPRRGAINSLLTKAPAISCTIARQSLWGSLSPRLWRWT